ncbi:MAG: HNH endonuclease [Sphingomonadales bacterium 32-64-17]|nr:MAG: HNH endonuclease [Sphingomonadales bacterium 32-64-17]
MTSASQQPADPSATCWLCGRLLGRRVQLHHVVPKAKRGKATVPVHPICHRTIHAHFTNAQLMRLGGAREPLLADVEVAKFLRWIADKPPDFHAPTRRQRR